MVQLFSLKLLHVKYDWVCSPPMAWAAFPGRRSFLRSLSWRICAGLALIQELRILLSVENICLRSASSAVLFIQGHMETFLSFQNLLQCCFIHNICRPWDIAGAPSFQSSKSIFQPGCHWICEVLYVVTDYSTMLFFGNVQELFALLRVR